MHPATGAQPLSGAERRRTVQERTYPCAGQNEGFSVASHRYCAGEECHGIRCRDLQSSRGRGDDFLMPVTHSAAPVRSTCLVTFRTRPRGSLSRSSTCPHHSGHTPVTLSRRSGRDVAARVRHDFSRGASSAVDRTGHSRGPKNAPRVEEAARSGAAPCNPVLLLFFELAASSRFGLSDLPVPTSCMRSETRSSMPSATLTAPSSAATTVWSGICEPHPFRRITLGKADAKATGSMGLRLGSAVQSEEVASDSAVRSGRTQRPSLRRKVTGRWRPIHSLLMQSAPRRQASDLGSVVCVAPTFEKSLVPGSPRCRVRLVRPSGALVGVHGTRFPGCDGDPCPPRTLSLRVPPQGPLEQLAVRVPRSHDRGR